jgi:methyl-accepting chemotaxis protein
MNSVRFMAEGAASIAKGFHEQAESGVISEDQAKDSARAAIGAIRYNGNEYLWVWTSNLISVVHANKGLVGKSGADIRDSDGVYVIRETVKGSQAIPPQFVRYGWPKSDGASPSEKIGYSIYFQPWDWVIGTGVYTDDLHSAFAQRMTVFGLAFAGVAAAALFFGGMLARSIRRPLDGIKTSMLQLADGNLDIEIAGTSRQDEIGDLGRAAQVLRDRSRDAARLAAEKETERTARDARGRTIDELTKAFDGQVSGVLALVGTVVSELETTATALSANSQQTNRQATTVATATEEASASVQTVATAAEELSSSIKEIARQVEQSSRIAQTASDEASRTNETVKGLATSSARIGDVVKLINDIASQTNLLALNATIEAARAGDAGKGFAVVAGEVKNLANQTAKATEEIGAQIGAVQASTEEAVAAIGAIVSRINEINQIAAAIAAAVEQQSAATGEIARNVQQAATGTQEVSANIGGVTQAAGETGAAASQLLSSTRSLARETSGLKDTVGTFLQGVRTA